MRVCVCVRVCVCLYVVCHLIIKDNLLTEMSGTEQHAIICMYNFEHHTQLVKVR